MVNVVQSSRADLGSPGPLQPSFLVTLAAQLFLDLTPPTLDSLDKGMRKNADGSVNIYLGPKALGAQESNWIYTRAEKSWFSWSRFYGPDIEIVKQ
jgi:hypothetical protein